MRKSKAKNKQLRQRQESVKHLLAESREVERKEKAASTTKNEDLFVIDTAAPKKKQQISETVQQAASQEKKKQLQKQIKLFDPMHMLQEKYGDSLLKPLGKDLPTPTPTSLAQTKKRKREEEVEDARKAKRARKQQQSTEAKKPAVFDLWAADAPVKASKKHRQSTAKVELVKPHAGQSYNPTESAHQEAIEMAYEGELELYMRAKSIKKQLSYDENHPAVASGTGDDVLDGFNMQDKVDEVEDLTQDNATTELHQKILTRKKKISREKKRNVNKHKKQIRQRVERMKNATTPHPKRVMKAINEYLGQSMKAKLALRAEEDAKKKAPIASVNGAIDVPLKEELSSNMRTINASSETLFSDAMRAMNKSGLFTPKSMRRRNMKWGDMIVK